MGGKTTCGGANRQVGELQGLCRHARRQGAEDLGGELGVDLQVVWVERSEAGRGGQRSRFHQTARRGVRYPDEVVDVRHPPCSQLLRREERGTSILQKVEVDVLDVGVIVC